MSGGSFGHAYFDAEELSRTLSEMQEWADENDVPQEAVDEVAELAGRLEENSDLLRAIEWYADGDSGIGRVKEVVGDGV